MSFPEFTGQFVSLEDARYESARVEGTWNRRAPDRFPAAVLFAADERDVVKGVRLARDRGLKVAVRAGGHSWAGWSIRDGALLIDLGRIREIELDPDTGIVKASPAVEGGRELSPYLSERGRMFPGGHCDSVGLGGFLLQGGQGWNSRAWGWGCENVIAIDVVTADGELVHASEEENSDLLWAARGAGPGFFGVVTRFYLRTYPTPAVPAQDTWTFAIEDTEPVLEWLHELLPTLAVQVEPIAAGTRLSDVPLFPGVQRPEGPVVVVHTTAMCDSEEEAAEVLRPLTECPLSERALGHEHGPTTLGDEYAMMGGQNPEGHRIAADCCWSDAPASELAPRLREIWSGLPTESSFSVWYGWAPQRPLPDMAFSLEGNVYLAVYASWTDPADDEPMRDWTHRSAARLAEVGSGAYLGDSDFTRRSDRFMSDEAFRRLEEIRARRDPDGLFCSYPIAADRVLNADAPRA